MVSFPTWRRANLKASNSFYMDDKYEGIEVKSQSIRSRSRGVVVPDRQHELLQLSALLQVLQHRDFA